MKGYIAILPLENGGYHVPQQHAVLRRVDCEIMFDPNQGWRVVECDLPECDVNQHRADEVTAELRELFA